MEVTSAARRELLAIAEVRGHVGQSVFKWRLDESISGTSGKAIVVSEQAAWATPPERGSSEYPTLWVDCYADPDRNAGGTVATANAEDKALALARVVKRHWHGIRGVFWGAVGSDRGLQVVSCEFVSRRVIEAGGQHEDREVMGDTVMCRLVFALHVSH